MEIDDFKYFIYDKFSGDHSFSNPKTIDTTLEKLFDSDFNTLEGKDAIKKFNNFGGNYVIPDDIDSELYKVIVFVDDKTKSIYTVIGINIKNLEKLVIDDASNNNIPNKNILINACLYHVSYTKNSMLNESNVDKKNKSEFDVIDELINIKKTILISEVINKTGDVTDPMIAEPNFLNCTLYDYQKRSIQWMNNIEKSYKKVNTASKNEIYIGSVLVNKATHKLIYEKDDKSSKSATFMGGALIDEVGLGKTIQTATMSILNPKKDIAYTHADKPNKIFSRATLIICPNQLCGQWKREFEKMVKKDYNLNIVSILTKVHFDKLNYIDLLDADFVIVSYSFLENKCFTDSFLTGVSKAQLKNIGKNNDALNRINDISSELNKNPVKLKNKNCVLPAIHWHRIIIDEFHEIFTLDKYDYMIPMIALFDSTYRWCVTGTPFDKGSDCLFGMMNFVTKKDNNNEKSYNNIILNDNIYNYMKKEFFRRNTKKSVMSEYQLPPINEKVVWLKFTATERMMYNSYLANPNVDRFSKYLRQLCCHPKLAEELKATLSNCKTLDDIQKMMVVHYEKNMKSAEDKMNYINERIKYMTDYIKIYTRKRQARFIRKMGFRVVLEDLPELVKPVKPGNENQIIQQQEEDNDEFYDDIVDNLEINDDDDDEKPLYTISDKNQTEVMKKIGSDWFKNSNTLEDLKDRLENIKNKGKEFTADYNGKRTTCEFYKNVMEKLKKSMELKTKLDLKKDNDDSDSYSDSECDSDDEEDEEKCGLCLGVIGEEDIGITKCGHMFCYQCIKTVLPSKKACPYCKKACNENEVYMISYEKPVKVQTQSYKDKLDLINQVGTKLANLIFYIKSSNKHSIIFSQWDDLLHKVGEVLNNYGIRNVFCKGNTWQRDKAIRTFNSDDSIKVIMLSSEKAASGTNLTKASQVILLDPVNGTYEYRKNTEGQAIGRAHRMGQTQEVDVVRFIIKNTIEEEIYSMNAIEDKKHVPTKKIFEVNDDTIQLSQDKIKEINDSAINNSQVKKVTKKKTTLKEAKEKLKVNNDDSDSDLDV